MKKIFGYVLTALPIFALVTFFAYAIATQIGFVWAMASVVIAMAMLASLYVGIDFLTSHN